MGGGGWNEYEEANRTGNTISQWRDEFEIMKILVTGTAGFIGFHLARRLLNEGDEFVHGGGPMDEWTPLIVGPHSCTIF